MHLGAVLSRRCAISKYFILMKEWIHWFIIWITAQCLPRVACYGYYTHTTMVFIDSWVTWFDLVRGIGYSMGSINIIFNSKWSKIRTAFPFSFYFKTFKLNAGKPVYETIAMDQTRYVHEYKFEQCIKFNILYIINWGILVVWIVNYKLVREDTYSTFWGRVKIYTPIF